MFEHNLIAADGLETQIVSPEMISYGANLTFMVDMPQAEQHDTIPYSNSIAIFILNFMHNVWNINKVTI